LGQSSIAAARAARSAAGFPQSLPFELFEKARMQKNEHRLRHPQQRLRKKSTEDAQRD
jgi:hypothetical protein